MYIRDARCIVSRPLWGCRGWQQFLWNSFNEGGWHVTGDSLHDPITVLVIRALGNAVCFGSVSLVMTTPWSCFYLTILNADSSGSRCRVGNKLFNNLSNRGQWYQEKGKKRTKGKRTMFAKWMFANFLCLLFQLHANLSRFTPLLFAESKNTTHSLFGWNGASERHVAL